MHFTYSTASLIEHSKNLFLSEEFAEAIRHLQLGLTHDGSMTPELILSLLKSEVGYNIVDIDENKTEVEFHKDFINPEYLEEVTQILENYDFLIKKEDKTYQVDSFFDFDLSHIAKTNSYIKELLSNEDKIIKKTDFKYYSEIARLMRENDFYEFEDAEYILYHNKRFYLIKPYTNPLVKEIASFYEPLEAVKAYQKMHDKYYA